MIGTTSREYSVFTSSTRPWTTPRWTSSGDFKIEIFPLEAHDLAGTKAQAMVRLGHSDQRLRGYHAIAAFGDLLVLLDRALHVAFDSFGFHGPAKRDFSASLCLS